MYAIVEIAGQQFKVEKDSRIFVHRLENDEGEQLEFEKVLLIGDGEKVTVGEPLIEGAMVAGKVISHPKGDKVIVFKKKRRKGYKVKKGHRQSYTEVLIESITEKGFVKKEKPAAKATKAARPAAAEVRAAKTTEPVAKAETRLKKAKVESKPVAEKKETIKAPAKKPAAKTAAKKTSAAKKPAAKKAGTKGKKEE